MMAAFLKLGSLRYLLPFCVFKYFSFFLCKSSWHLKNITLLNIDLCACVCACVSVCVLMNNKPTKD